MGGGGKQPVEPKEEIKLDTTNFGLWNVSENGMSIFGVGGVLTIMVLVLVLAIIAKYCCERAAVARKTELEEKCKSRDLQKPGYAIVDSSSGSTTSNTDGHL